MARADLVGMERNARTITRPSPKIKVKKTFRLFVSKQHVRCFGTAIRLVIFLSLPMCVCVRAFKEFEPHTIRLNATKNPLNFNTSNKKTQLASNQCSRINSLQPLRFVLGKEYKDFLHFQTVIFLQMLVAEFTKEDSRYS